MTNAEIIQAFREEIARLQPNAPKPGNMKSVDAKVAMQVHARLNKLLSFLSDLEKSLPAKVADGEVLEWEINRTYHDGSVADTSDIDHVTYENIAEYFYNLGCRRTAEKYDELEYNRQRAEESEKPMNLEGLEEEIQRFLSNATKMDKGEWKGKYPISEMGFGVVARHFAQWGAEHLKK